MLLHGSGRLWPVAFRTNTPLRHVQCAVAELCELLPEGAASSWRSCDHDRAGPLSHGLRAVQGFTDDVGVAGVLRGLGDDVEQNPASRPACARLKPWRLREWMGQVK